MGRKGSWFAAIRQVFVPSSKEKSTDLQGQEKKTTKEKKKGRGILRAREKSFIPFFREPSSIEKILGEVDEEKIFRPPISAEQKTTTFISNRPTSSPQAASSSMPSLLRVASPRVSPPRTTYRKVSSPKHASPEVSPPRPTYKKVSSPKHASPEVSPPRPTYKKVASPKTASPKAVSPTVSPPRTTYRKVSTPKLEVAPPRPTYQKVASPKAASPTVSPPRTTYQKVDPIRAASSTITHNCEGVSYRLEPTGRDLHMSAIKVQTAFRGYKARRSFRALRGLRRLQGVVRGQNVKRQTMNTMKQMQLLVKVQNQIHFRRTQMLANKALQCQSYKNDKEMESTVSKSTCNQLGPSNSKEWDDSVLTKEKREERLRKRAEAVIKRERAMSYAYSNQLWKPQPKSARAALGGFPWWGNWLEDHSPLPTASEYQTPLKNIHLTPPRSVSEQRLSPWLQASSYKHHSYSHENHEQLTPWSSKSSIPIRGKHFLQTPSRTPLSNGSSSMQYPRPRVSATNSRFGLGMRDDDSLTSCPPFSVPNYMQPTVSAKAKVRAYSHPKERVLGTPGNESKRRFSFLLTPNISPFNWNRGSVKDSSSQRTMDKHSVQSTDDRMSMGSAVSMPALVGRKPFNRFV